MEGAVLFPRTSGHIQRFRKSRDPWLVVVNMVSEGVDIRRLRVVVYLTNRLTALSFRQIVGRVVRIDETNVDDRGRVYLPADPSLTSMARAVTDEVKILPPPIVIEGDERGTRRVVIRDDGTRERTEFESLGSVGLRGGATDTGGRQADERLVQLARAYIRQQRLTGTDPVSLALAASENEKLRQALQRTDG